MDDLETGTLWRRVTSRRYVMLDLIGLGESDSIRYSGHCCGLFVFCKSEAGHRRTQLYFVREKFAYDFSLMSYVIIVQLKK